MASTEFFSINSVIVEACGSRFESLSSTISFCFICGALVIIHYAIGTAVLEWWDQLFDWLATEFNNHQPCNLCSISDSLSTRCAIGYVIKNRRCTCWCPDSPHIHGLLLSNACAYMVSTEPLLPYFYGIFPLSTSNSALIAYGANLRAASLLRHWHDDTSIICQRYNKHMVDASWCRKPNLV